jgi:uncharacterized protein YjcR
MDSITQGLNTSGKIGALMGSRNISKKDLAELLNVTEETIRNWMKSGGWDSRDLYKVAETYGVDIKDLI